MTDDSRQPEPAPGQPPSQPWPPYPDPYPQTTQPYAVAQPYAGPPPYAGPQPYYGPPVGWRPGPNPIAKHGVWLAVGLLLFHPLGLYALLAHFIQIDPEYNRGNRAGAQAHADSVRRLGQIALVVGIVVIGLYLTLVISTSR